MAYSDYGGYAFRNGIRVRGRSDATITPGGIFESPGQWPGFHQYGVDGKKTDFPYAHVVIGDGPIFVTLYKQSSLAAYRADGKTVEEIDLKGLVGPLALVTYGESTYLNDDHFKAIGEPLVIDFEGRRLTVYWEVDDNHYMYAQLDEPGGNYWCGWSGYGVGEGLEDCGYGYSTEDRNARLREIWPDAIKAEVPNAQ